MNQSGYSVKNWTDMNGKNRVKVLIFLTFFITITEFLSTFASVKNSVLLFLILSSPWAKAQSIKDLDQAYGFNTFRFEENIANYPTLVAFDQTKDSQFVFYRNSDEGNHIDGANIDVIYTFFKGQLSTVLIQTTDSAGSRTVLRYLERQYGKGVKKEPYIEQYMWNGTKVLLSYYEGVNSFISKVFISSIKMKLIFEGRDKY